jgi:hypothetical protein
MAFIKPRFKAYLGNLDHSAIIHSVKNSQPEGLTITFSDAIAFQRSGRECTANKGLIFVTHTVARGGYNDEQRC